MRCKNCAFRHSSVEFIDKVLHVDDPVGAISVHVPNSVRNVDPKKLVEWEKKAP